MNKSILTLFLTFSTMICVGQQNTKTDSLLTEVKDNIVFVVHKVLPKQTLYSLLKKYDATATELMMHNPTLGSQTSIQIGQILRFPYKINGVIVRPQVVKKENNSTSIKTKESQLAAPGNKHEVKPGDTMFSLSKLYGIDIIEFADANDILENKLSLGQLLIVDKEEIKKLLAAELTKKENEEKFKQLQVGKMVSEVGLGKVINTSNRNTKYLVLHKTAPVGSVVSITNEANGATINAKVVGNLREDSPDQNILIKLSPSAFSKLRPKDSKFRAKVIYFDPSVK
jgi:LysM repeat protein